MAAASHLPFVAATALVQAVAPGLDDLAGMVAASGFRDTTRVAMASPVMHADVCNYNAAAIAELIDRLQAELDRMKGQLNDLGIQACFEQAAQLRQQWAERHDRMVS